MADNALHKFKTQELLHKVLNSGEDALKVDIDNVTLTTEGADVNIEVHSDKAEDSMMMWTHTVKTGTGGTSYVPLVDADGHFQVDTLSSALPSGAATEAKQDDIESSLTDIESDIEATNTALGTIETDIEATNTALGTTNTALGTIETDIEATNTALGTTNTALGTIETDIEATNTALGTIETDIEATNTALGTIETDIEATNTALGTIETDIEATNTALGTIETDIEAVNTDTTSIDGKITACNTGAVVISSGVQTDALTDTQLRATAVPISGTVTAVTDITNAVTTDHNITGIASGRKVVSAAATAEAISGAQACKNVDITAETDNTGVIVVGGTTVVAAVGTRQGTPLNAGDSYSIDIDDLSDIFIDATVSGEGVSFTYFT